jgi:uncharacterized protein
VTTLILTLASTALALSAVAVILVWHFQERIVFQPPRNTRPSLPAEPRNSYAAADGTTLFAYVVGSHPPGAPVVLAFHGNAELARWRLPWAVTLARHTGACVVLAECRGYDSLAGRPTYRGAALDARAALQFVRDNLHVAADRTVYFGHSLGSAIAAELACESPPAALVLQSPFSSARAIAARVMVPGLGVLWDVVARIHYDTLMRVQESSATTWVAHGDRDRLIPIGMGRAVFAAAARPGKLLVVPGAGHNDVDAVGGSAYWEWWREALRPVTMR